MNEVGYPIDDLLTTLKKDVPQVVRLATVVSIASRIEPMLLRRARLKLCPGLGAGVEIELWHSPLVQASSPLAMSLHPTAAKRLQQEFRDDADLRKAYELIAACHKSLPEAIRIEEEITWRLLSQEADFTEPVTKLLQKAVNSLVDGNRPELAHWVSRFLARAPDKIRKLPAAWLLNLAASSRLGGVQVMPAYEPPPDLQSDELIWALFQTEKAGRLYLGRDGGELLLSVTPPADPDAPFREIPIPLTDPVVIEIDDNDSAGPRLERLEAAGTEILRIGLRAPVLKLRTAAGDVYNLVVQTVEGEYLHEDVAQQTKESDYTAPQKVCFVIQGFGIQIDFRTERKFDLDASYQTIKEAVEYAGMECVRADEISNSGALDKPGFENLIASDIVIADLSTADINTAYQLGTRHALCPRGTIIVAENQGDVAFDVSSIAMITYEHSGAEIGDRERKRFTTVMIEAIKAKLSDRASVDSPLYASIPQLLPPDFSGSESSYADHSKSSGPESVGVDPDTSREKSTKKICFVVQGFGKKTDYRTGRTLDLDVSYQIIKMAVENAGLICMRADENRHPQIIDDPLFEAILTADLVIADLSTSNFNVAYQLGIRHAVRPRGTIIVAEKQWKSPFDIHHTRIYSYEHRGSDIGRKEARRFSAELTKVVSAVLDDSAAVDSPLYMFFPELAPPAYPGLEASFAQEFLTSAIDSVGKESESEIDKSMKEFTDRGKRALREGDFEAAKELYKAAHEIRPNDETILQKLALVTYKSKKPSEKEALWEAHDLIRDKLEPERVNDPETIGLWAAVHKRLWQLTHDTKHLTTSINALQRGFELQNDYYTGINLAFMLNVRVAQTETAPEEARADYSRARRVRRRVIKICKDIVDAGNKEGEDMFWALAALWEAAVGIEDAAQTKQWEAQTKKFAKDNNLPDWMMDSTEEQIGKLNQIMKETSLSGPRVL